MTTLTDIETTPLSGLNHIDALLDKGPDWNFAAAGVNAITYTFSTSSGLQADDGATGFNSGSVRTFNVEQQTAARTAFSYLSALTGIKFVETATGSAAQMHLAAADLTGPNTTGLSSWGANWNVNTRTGEITNYQISSYVYLDNVQWIGRNNNPAPGGGGYETLLHELGHALGLKHPFEDDIVLPRSQDSTVYTLMSYADVGGPYSAMRPFDVAALNWLYGGDGLGGALGIGSTTGARYLTGTAGGDSLLGTQFNDTLRGEQGNDMLKGAAGIDTAIFSGAKSGYAFTQRADGSLAVVGADGTDTLDSVEYLQFSDGKFSLAELGDTTAPVAPELKVPRNVNGFVSGNAPTFSGRTEANAVVKVYSGEFLIATGQADAGGNYSAVSTALSSGSFSVFATSTDTAGNVSAVTDPLIFYVDVSAPAAPTGAVVAGTSGRIDGNQAVFSGFGEAGSTINLVDVASTGVTLLASTKVGVGGEWSVTSAPILNGNYNVTVQSVDAADNFSTYKTALPFSVSSTLNRTGTATKDSLTGSVGNNAIDGREGVDTAVYTGASTGFTLGKATYGFSVASAATGTDSLINVERIKFSDKSIAIDIDGNGGQAYRLYSAAFDRAPDLEGLGFWMDARDNGVELDHIANEFLNSKEFVTKFGANQTNEQFLTRLYDYVMNRTPDGEGYQFWLDALEVGVSRAHLLAQFSESNENRGNVIDIIANGFEYQPWGA